MKRISDPEEQRTYDTKCIRRARGKVKEQERCILERSRESVCVCVKKKREKAEI